MEKVADRSDSARVSIVEQSAEKLRNIISHIETEIACAHISLLSACVSLHLDGDSYRPGNRYAKG